MTTTVANRHSKDTSTLSVIMESEERTSHVSLSYPIASIYLREDHAFLQLVLDAWHLTESQTQTLIIASLMS